MFRTLTSFVLAIALALATRHTVHADLMEYTSGHADIGLAYEGGELELHYHFGINAVVNGSALAADLELAPAEAYVRVPDLVYNSDFAAGFSQFDFTGRTASDPDLWLLPSNNISNVPFLGFATEELESADWVNGDAPITYQLDSWSFTAFGTGVADRANFSLYQISGLTPNVMLATSDGVDGADSFTPPIGHDHFNFSFTEEGIYGVTLTASGTHVTDGFKSSTGTFFFSVGDGTPGPSAVPEPSMFGMLLIASTGIGVSLFIRKRRQTRTVPCKLDGTCI